MIQNLTVLDILNARARSRKNLDTSKTCESCKYKIIPKDDKPCSRCVNSFIGIVFSPTEWEAQP